MRWTRVFATGAVVLGLSAGAFAQEDLEKGKNGAQLFATDCGICHKSAQALVKPGVPNEAFLRVHYTSSREMAAAITSYLSSLARAQPAGAMGKKRRQAKPADAAEPQAASEQKASHKKASAKQTGEAAAPEKKRAPQKKDQPESKKE